MSEHESATPSPCPCGSGSAFERCCRPLLEGVAAPTAEALMRSRYTGYVRGATDYLLRTWDPATRPVAIDPTAGPVWQRLEIVARSGGGPSDSRGTVEFVAHYLDGGQPGRLHETSRFRREAGRWLYVGGKLHATAQPGRNTPCPCGSGRKFKRCCGA